MKGTRLLDKKLLMYSAAVGALGVAGGSADAFIDYYNFPTGKLGYGGNECLLSFDLAGNVYKQGEVGPYAQFAFIRADNSRVWQWESQTKLGLETHHHTGHSLNSALWIDAEGGFAVATDGSGWADVFQSAQPIGPSLSWGRAAQIARFHRATSAPTSISGSSGGSVLSSGYLGLEFDDNGTPVYGWANVETTLPATWVILYSYAYEDDGGAIRANEILEPPSPQPSGTIPEPCTLALLTMGAAGVAILRRGATRRGTAASSEHSPRKLAPARQFHNRPAPNSPVC